MKGLFALLLAMPLLLIGCSDTVEPGAGKGSLPFLDSDPLYKTSSLFPLRVGGSRRYLIDQTNTPFFMSVDAAWSLIAQLNASDADTYFKSRASNGFNVVIVNLIEHQFSANAPKNIYGVPPFTGKTFTTPNEPYFKYADSVIAMAAKYNITIMLFPAYSGYQLGSQGWGAEMTAASDADMLSWGRYVGNRYRSFPNIIWCLGGDADPDVIQSKLQNVKNGIRQTDPNHIMTAHNAPESYGITPWAGQLDINNVYTYSNTLYSNCRTAYNYPTTMPYFLIESAYENEHASTQQSLRAQEYWTLLSGGCGVVYGNNPMWFFGSGWKTALNSGGTTSIKYLSKIFTSRHWWLLIPDFSNTIITSGAGSSTSYSTAAYCSDGSSIIAYLPTSRQITLNTSRISTSLVQIAWYNPSNGAITQVGKLTRGATILSPPASGDWVLVADATTLTPLPIQIASFTIVRWGSSATLNWTTASEVNNYGFYVQRRTSNTPFSDLPESFIPGHGSIDIPQSYTFTDSSTLTSAQYRLRQLDLDGTVHFTDAIPVQ